MTLLLVIASTWIFVSLALGWLLHIVGLPRNQDREVTIHKGEWVITPGDWKRR